MNSNFRTFGFNKSKSKINQSQTKLSCEKSEDPKFLAQIRKIFMVKLCLREKAN